MGTSLRTLISIFLSSVMVICVRPDTVVVVGQKPFVGGGGGPAAFSDDFNRANSTSLGSNWSEIEGDAEISGNELQMVTGSFGAIWVPFTGTSCTTASQYVRITNTDIVGADYLRVMFRYTNPSSEFYAVQLECSSGNLEWQHFANDTASETVIATGSFGVWAEGNTLAITIIGTGTSTVVRIWRNPTGNTPDSGGTTWGGAAPGVSFTTDPADPADSGLIVGLGAVQAGASNINVENFFGGDVP
jgi:hypothetical protein